MIRTLFVTIFCLATSFAGDTEEIQALIERSADRESFERGLAEMSLGDQARLEARVFFGFRTRDWESLFTLIPDYEAMAAEKPTSFTVMQEDLFHSLLYAIKAKKAESEGDKAGFRENILQAYWESPGMSMIFTQWIEEHRKAARQADIRVPLDTELLDHEGNKATLGALVEGKKGLVLDFWASWCKPCIASMGEINEKYNSYKTKDVVWVGVNTEASAEIADKFKTRYEIESPWLVEPSTSPYSRLLNVNSIPRAILIDAAGEIHFDGHPQDPRLDAAVSSMTGM